MRSLPRRNRTGCPASLTAGIDVQADRLECEIVCWGGPLDDPSNKSRLSRPHGEAPLGGGSRRQQNPVVLYPHLSGADPALETPPNQL